MANAEKSKVKTCAYCGSIALTRDHVPPKTLFRKPLPSNAQLITVPACPSCNRIFGKLDEEAGVFLDIWTSAQPDSPWPKFSETSLRALKRSRKLRRQVLQEIRQINLRSMGGVIVAESAEIHWPSQHFDRFFARLIKGLWFHHKSIPLPENCSINAFPLKQSTADELRALRINERMAYFNIANNQFEYLCGFLDKDPRISIWYLRFHTAYMVAAETRPTKLILPNEINVALGGQLILPGHPEFF